MSETWFVTAGCSTNREYAYPDVRAFHAAVLKAYKHMRKSLYCAQVILPPEFGGCFMPLRYTVWCCYTPDNFAPRLVCLNREMTLKIISPTVIGVDERRHGGSWFSRDLIYSFVAGLTEEANNVPDQHIICKCALNKPCGGRRPNERYLMKADLKNFHDDEIFRYEDCNNEENQESENLVRRRKSCRTDFSVNGTRGTGLQYLQNDHRVDHEVNPVSSSMRIDDLDSQELDELASRMHFYEQTEQRIPDPLSEAHIYHNSERYIDA